MKIQRFGDPVLFQERVQDFLMEHEAENNMPLGILNGVISGEYQAPYMAYVENEGSPVIVMLCTPPHPVIFSYQDPVPLDNVLEMALLDRKDFFDGALPGMTGNKKLMTRMSKISEKVFGIGTELHATMRIYKIDEVIPPRATSGSIRPTEKNDRRLMMDWLERFYREVGQESPDPARVRRQVDRYLGVDLKSRGLMIWEKNGIPVSMAGYTGPTPNGIRIGAVYTPPEQRKKGYASAVTAGLSQQLLEMGYKFCFLFTDLLNPTSNHIYQQIGYKPVCDVDRYDFKLC